MGVIGIYGCLFGSDAERRREDGHVGRIAQGPACKSSSLPHNNCPRQPSIALSPAPLSPPHSLHMPDNMGRRRSVDVGGLALALADQGCGHGWGGWEETDCGETRSVTCSDARSPPSNTPVFLQICGGSHRRPSSHRDHRQPGGRSCVRPSPVFFLPSPPPHSAKSPSWVDMDPETRARLIHSLSSWHFEPHKLPEEEVIACSYILFEALYRIEHMAHKVPVSLSKLYHLLSSPFLFVSIYHPSPYLS